jgi:hypothetical protein
MFATQVARFEMTTQVNVGLVLVSNLTQTAPGGKAARFMWLFFRDLGVLDDDRVEITEVEILIQFELALDDDDIAHRALV